MPTLAFPRFSISPGNLERTKHESERAQGDYLGINDPKQVYRGKPGSCTRLPAVATRTTSKVELKAAQIESLWAQLIPSGVEFEFCQLNSPQPHTRNPELIIGAIGSIGRTKNPYREYGADQSLEALCPRFFLLLG